MSREVSADFQQFAAHLRQASFEDILAVPEYVTQLRNLHRCFLSLLTLANELTDPEGELVGDFAQAYGERGVSYCREVVSDVGQGIFCWVAGAYKAELVTLRSSIESFAKCFSAQQFPEVLTRTNVYSVFELSSTSQFFLTPIAAAQFVTLRQMYDQLNQYVHTVADESMFQVLQLGVYPQHDTRHAAPAARYIERTVNAFVFASVMGMREWVWRIHHKNRELILSGLQPAQRIRFNE